MQREKWLIAALSLFAVTITVWFIFSAEPEEAFVQSADRVVTLVGQGSRAKEWQVRAVGAPLGAPLSGYAYELSPVGRQPVAATLGIVAPGATTLYYLNPELSVWEVVPEGEKTAAGIRAAVRDFGTYAVGAALQEATPTFASDQEEMLTAMPANTIGYDVILAVAEPGGPAIIIPQNTRRYFCDGRAQDYKDVAYTRRDREIEGKKYQLFFRWLIADHSCASGVLK